VGTGSAGTDSAGIGSAGIGIGSADTALTAHSTGSGHSTGSASNIGWDPDSDLTAGSFQVGAPETSCLP